MRAIRTHDDGFAMVAVMGAIALITVVAIGGYVLSANVMGESQRVQAESRAFQIAQSALDQELAGFQEINVDNGTYSGDLRDMDDGSYSIVVERSPDDPSQYDMTVTGYFEGSSESINLHFYSMDLWGMNIGAGDDAIHGGGGNGDWNGNARVEGPLYTKGNVLLEASSSFELGPLFVFGGDLIVMGEAAEIGQEYGAVDIYCNGEVDPDVVRPGKRDIGNISSQVPDINLPWVDEEYMDERLAIALEESVDNIQGSPSKTTLENTESTDSDPDTYETLISRDKAPGASEHYKFVGDGTNRASLGAGSHDLTIDLASFGAWGYGPTGNAHDDFAFDAATGTLYVEGAVFIDGDLRLGENVQRYVGNGSLVVNGDVVILGDLEPASGSISAEEALGIVTPGDIDIGADPENTGRFTGAIFANGAVSLRGSGSAAHYSEFCGSVLCGQILSSSPNQVLRTDPTKQLSKNIPDGMPLSNALFLAYGNWTRQ